MKYDKDTMNSLQEAYASVNETYKGGKIIKLNRNKQTGNPPVSQDQSSKTSDKKLKGSIPTGGDGTAYYGEEQEHEGMTYKNKQKQKRQQQLLDASKNAPTYKNKIVPTKTRTEEAIKMSRKEYTSEAKIDSIYSKKKNFRGIDQLTQKRNERNATPGQNRDIDRKAFITREPGEPEDVARGRARKQFSDQQRGKKKIKGSKTKSSSAEYLYNKKKTISDRKNLDRIFNEEEMGKKNCGCGETPCKTYGNVNEKKKEMDDKMKEVEDMRSLPTRMNLIKTKLRAMGLNMSHQLKGKELSEVIDYTLAERNRYEKETGIDTKTGKKIVKGGTAKNDKAFQIVMKKYNPQRMGANEPKKNRREKPDERPGKYTIMLQKKRDQQAKNKAFAARAKAAGETPQQRADRIAIYGSEEDMEKGIGSGS